MPEKKELTPQERRPWTICTVRISCRLCLRTRNGRSSAGPPGWRTSVLAEVWENRLACYLHHDRHRRLDCGNGLYPRSGLVCSALPDSPF